MKHILIYLTFVKQQIKSLIEYKVDFAMGIVGLLIQQISTFLMLFVIFTQINSIASFSFEEILLIYGYSQIIRGIDHIFNDNIWEIGWRKIRNGSMTMYFVKPINILWHIVMEKIQFDGIGEVAIGIIIFLYAKTKLNLVLGLKGSFLLVFFMLCGLIVYFAIKLICSSIAFWTVSSGELMSTVYEINSFTKYPLDIYSNLVKLFLTFIFPFAIVSYYPIVYFIRDSKFLSNVLGINIYSNNLIIILISLVTLILISFAMFLWKMGLKRYEASGT